MVPARAAATEALHSCCMLSSGRRGFAFPLLIVMILVLGGVLYSVNQVVTGYRQRSTRFRDGEVAYYAARGALRIAEKSLEKLLAGPPPESGRGRDLYLLLTRTRPEDLVGSQEELEIPYLSRLLPATAQGGEVSAKVRLQRVEPLGIAVPPGFPVDPYEKRGVLEIEVRAEVGAAVRRVVMRRPFLCMYRLPPVVGRFSLLYGGYEGAPETLNPFSYAPRLGLFQTSVGGNLAWPLAVYPLPFLGDGRTPEERWGSDPVAAVADGGWVGLLGERPWTLNLTFGAGDASPLEEGRLVRTFESVFPSTALSGVYEKARRFGFARNLLQLPMFSAFEAGEIPDTSGLLHLAGDSREPLPPFVLGRVFRRYLTFSKLARDPDGPFTSFFGREQADHDSSDADFQAAAGTGDYAAYRQAMARAVVEPYNRTFDFVVTDATRRDESGRILAGGTPWQPRRHLGAGQVGDWIRASGGGEGFLYPQAAGSGDERAFGDVQVLGEGGAVLFDGDLQALLPGLAELLPARAVEVLAPTASESVADLFRQRYLDEDGALDLGHAVHLTGGGLNLDLRRVARGGTLMVDGDLRVSGPLEVAPGEVLALVSLSGNVVVTNAEPIHAALVAPRGEVIPSPQGMDLRGALVAARLDASRWLGVRGATRVVYDHRFNPARDSRRAAQVRVHLGDQRELVLLRSDDE